MLLKIDIDEFGALSGENKQYPYQDAPPDSPEQEIVESYVKTCRCFVPFSCEIFQKTLAPR
jgi:hypothetical protein